MNKQLKHKIHRNASNGLCVGGAAATAKEFYVSGIHSHM